MWEEQLKIYDTLVSKSNRYIRKGKTMPHTAANGYMFSLLNKDAEFGIRLPKSIAETFKTTYNSTIFKSHGAVMKDYVLIPNNLLVNDLNTVFKYLEISFDFVMTLKQK